MTDIVATREQYLRRGRMHHRRMSLALGIVCLVLGVWTIACGAWLWAAAALFGVGHHAFNVLFHPMGRSDS